MNNYSEFRLWITEFRMIIWERGGYETVEEGVEEGVGEFFCFVSCISRNLIVILQPNVRF